ncbi:hypothetical protein L3Y34_016152 [Caenorhabditis briggsae]|uniref:Uncharacterized protein n=1 Tax=Caenorhabditis briggsae TaxID=6238 RepID=A0AAE9DZE5_CAEBR|nr:hypothetical protein L3Y34_016152 [Caenorhabditis briggsae]
MENAYKANREILKKGVGIEQSDIEADIKRKALEKRKNRKRDAKRKPKNPNPQPRRRDHRDDQEKRRTEDCNSEKAFNSKHKKMEQKTKPSAIQKKKEKTWSLQKTQGTLEEPPTTKRNTPARKNKKTAQPPTDFHNSVLQNMEKELGDEQFSSVFTKKKKTATRKK